MKLLASILLVGILFNSRLVFAQIDEITLVQHGISNKSIFPTAIYEDTLTEVYKTTFLTINGRYQPNLTRSVKLHHMNVKQLFFELKQINVKCQNIPSSNVGCIKIYLTKDLTIVDSIVTQNYVGTECFIRPFLDQLDFYSNKSLFIAFNSILVTLGPRYYEKVE